MERLKIPGKKPTATEEHDPQPAAFSAPDPQNWITVKEAAHCLRVSRRTLLRMSETIDHSTGRTYLRAWRPTPGTVMICRRSLQQFCQSTLNDPEFWQRREREALSADAPKRRRRRKARR